MFILEHGLCQSAIELINCGICKGNILGLKTEKAHIFAHQQLLLRAQTENLRTGEGSN